MWIEPTQRGIYVGNCAEYCGMQHAHMMLRVIVHSADEFAKWAAEQKQTPADEPQPRAGRAVFPFRLPVLTVTLSKGQPRMAISVRT